MKVFCCDCRSIVWGYLRTDEPKCSNPLNMKRFIRRNKLYMKNCSDLNQNGDCQQYKRKWYKILKPKNPNKIKVLKDRNPGDQ
jgi:hypothetical protein